MNKKKKLASSQSPWNSIGWWDPGEAVGSVGFLLEAFVWSRCLKSSEGTRTLSYVGCDKDFLRKWCLSWGLKSGGKA